MTIPLKIISDGTPTGTRIEGLPDLEIESIVILLDNKKPGEAVIKARAHDVRVTLNSKIELFCPRCYGLMRERKDGGRDE